MKRSGGTGGGAERAGKKKVKFDNDNSIAAVDGQDDEDLEFGARKRKGAIKQGYTDSDDEEGGAADSDEDSGKEEEEGDKDMDQQHEQQQQKGPKFLSKDTVDGVGAEGDGNEDLEIMPFNMDDELEEGAFDENFNYVRKKDEHDVHDKWLGGISNDQIRKAKLASERIKARVDALDALEDDVGDENSAWKNVLRLMKPRESVAGTLKRLGGPKKVPAWKKNKKNVNAPEATVESPDEEAERKKNLSDLIAVSDRLTSFGRYDVMEQTYESIVRSLRIAGILAEDWQPGDPIPNSSSSVPSSSSTLKQQLLWEYKLGQDSLDLMGPFPSSQMLERKDAKEFNDKDVWVRLVVANTPLDANKNFQPLAYVDLETGEGAESI